MPPMTVCDALVRPHRDFDSTLGYPGEGPPEVGCECCPPGQAGRVQANRPWATDTCGFCDRPAQRNKWGSDALNAELSGVTPDAETRMLTRIGAVADGRTGEPRLTPH